MARHSFPEKIVVYYSNPISKAWVTDQIIYFDGRMSQRTAREYFLEKVREHKREYKRLRGAPIQAQFYASLGKGPSSPQSMPFVPATQYEWDYQSFRIYAYRPFGEDAEDTTHIVDKDGKVFDLRYLPENNDGKVALEIYTTENGKESKREVARREGQAYHLLLHGVINDLKEEIYTEKAKK